LSQAKARYKLNNLSRWAAAGEHMDEFENFEAKAFVGRLLGKGDWTGFMDKIKVFPAIASWCSSMNAQMLATATDQVC